MGINPVTFRKCKDRDGREGRLTIGRMSLTNRSLVTVLVWKEESPDKPEAMAVCEGGEFDKALDAVLRYRGPTSIVRGSKDSASKPTMTISMRRVDGKAHVKIWSDQTSSNLAEVFVEDDNFRDGMKMLYEDRPEMFAASEVVFGSGKSHRKPQ